VRTSPNGRKLITLEEGRARFDSKTGLYFPYRDQIGKWTIGVGHLIRPDEDFKSGITSERVDQLLEADVMKCDMAIDGLLRRKGRTLNQNQWDALSSLLFNIGVGWANPERGSLARAIDNGQFENVPDLFLLYDVADGKHTSYLAARRRREAKHWSTPVAEKLDEVLAAANHAASLRFDAIDLAREAEVELLADAWEGSEDETPTLPGKKA
jgi:lysozyme